MATTVQVVMLKTYCGPSGMAQPGDVLEITGDEAKKLCEPDPPTAPKVKPGGGYEVDKDGVVQLEVTGSHLPFARKVTRDDRIDLFEDRPTGRLSTVIGRTAIGRRR